MYRKIFGLVTLFCIAVLVFNWAKDRRNDAPGDSAIKGGSVEPLFCFAPNANLGIFRDNRIVEHHFSFENRGHNDITIKNVSVSCSCIISKPQKDLVTPGERGEIVVEVDLADQSPGSHSYRAEISYQEGEITYVAYLHLFCRKDQKH